MRTRSRSWLLCRARKPYRSGTVQLQLPHMQLAIACDAIVKKAEGNEEMKVAELVAPKEAAAEEAAE